MMVCSGCSVRADFRMGSIIRIREEYENERRQRGWCNHDELMIVGISHTYANRGIYTNGFTAIPADCEYPPYSGKNTYPQTGAQRAIVTDNQDPDQLGRVRVQFLWQQEQDASLMTTWIRIAQPHGGENKGFYFIPEIDEEVMVAFENGNAEKPYVAGTLYHGYQRPESSWINSSNDIKAIRTRSGHTIEFHDTEGKEQIKIYDNGKNNFELTFSTHEQLVKVKSKGNIELYSEKNVLIDAKENITFSAGKNISETAGDNISIDAGKNMNISAGKDMVLDAENNMTESAGKDFTLSVSDNTTVSIGKDLNLSVSQNMESDISKNLVTTVSGKFNLKADNIEQVSGKNIHLSAKKIEQKADNGIAIDGGMKLDVKSSNTQLK